jgi:hypothetical protein
MAVNKGIKLQVMACLGQQFMSLPVLNFPYSFPGCVMTLLTESVNALITEQFAATT